MSCRESDIGWVAFFHISPHFRTKKVRFMIFEFLSSISHLNRVARLLELFQGHYVFQKDAVGYFRERLQGGRNGHLAPWKLGIRIKKF